MIKKLTIMIFALTFCFASHAQEVIDISTDEVSLILCAGKNGEVTIQHFGGHVVTENGWGHIKQKTYRRTDHGGNDLIYPAMGGRNFREPALRITHADGDMNTELKYVSHEKRTLADDNVSETVIRMTDRKLPLDADLIFTAYAKENIITIRTVIRNRENGPVTLHSFYSSYLSLRAEKYLLTHLHGAWAREAQISHTLLTHGSKSIFSTREVRTTHTENPSFMISLNTDSFNEDYGEVIAGALAWSGNFRLNFEIDEFDVLNILAGANPDASEYILNPGETFTTPEMIYTHSFEGAGGASRNLHDWARNYGIYAKKAAPTLLNSWEGAYFDFDADVLKKMIDDAAGMGLEMFVLDDGWFGNKYPRNDAKMGLGDWQVNKAKLPAGIDDIASYAHGKGMKFGIWIEPEMVSPKSELAEKHPEWIVKAEGRDIPKVRNQWLLDLSNPEVQDFVFSVFDNTMKLSKNIDYIKWDANRNANSVGSSHLPADRQSHFWIDYAQGFYNVLERIRAKYPDVMVQACASGGGRVEYGALKYFDEFWTSDNTEALSRAKIQYGTSLFYPAIVMGSHVSAVPNHQSGNVTPLKFRFDMACSGRLGMELQPKDMSEDEKAFAKTAIENYKEYRDIIMYGDQYRIGSPYDDSGCYGVLYVAKDKSRAVFFAYCIEYQSRSRIPEFRLKGLRPDWFYMMREINVEKPTCWFHAEFMRGDALMNVGINMPLRKVYDSTVILLEAEYPED